MTINALTGVSAAYQQSNRPNGVTAIPAPTTFGQELDAQTSRAGAEHSHHRHGGAAHSATSSAAAAASAAGVVSPASIGSAVLNLLP